MLDDSSRPDSPSPASPQSRADRRPFLRRPTLYPALYTWYVLVSALDILFTWRILRADGVEVNVLANWVIDQHDIRGLAVFKFLTVVVVILICEVVGRRQYETGAKLARWAVVLSAFPVVVGAAQLLRIAMDAVTP